MKNKAEVFHLSCPSCHALLWIDPVTRKVMQFEKAAKKKGSLEDLLLKEKKKKKEFERKFQATAELERKKRKKAQERFRKALTQVERKD